MKEAWGCCSTRLLVYVASSTPRSVTSNTLLHQQCHSGSIASAAYPNPYDHLLFLPLRRLNPCQSTECLLGELQSWGEDGLAFTIGSWSTCRESTTSIGMHKLVPWRTNYNPGQAFGLRKFDAKMKRGRTREVFWHGARCTWIFEKWGPCDAFRKGVQVQALIDF